MKNPSFAWERVEFYQTLMFDLVKKNESPKNPIMKKTMSPKKSHSDWIRDHWTIPGFLALDQESRVPLNQIFRIYSFFFFFLPISFLPFTQEGEKRSHSVWI